MSIQIQPLVTEMQTAGATVRILDSFSGSAKTVTAVWDGYEISSYHADAGVAAQTVHRQFAAIQRMREAGYTVRLDVTSNMAFRVRVSRKDGRKTIYNEHTTSASGYPILTAYEKWQRATGGAK